MIKPTQRLTVTLAALLILASPIFSAALTLAPSAAQAQGIASDADLADGSSDEDTGSALDGLDQEYLDAVEGASVLTNAGELAWAIDSDKLTLAPQDVNNIRDSKVDVRVTDYLLSLVKPVEQGGYGLGPIKVERIAKNYSTNGIGRLDREGLDAQEEDSSTISPHHDSKAVDISEIGEVTCKLVKKRHLGGSTTTWLDPRPIKVAWQSRDGISRFPTPTGDSLIGTSAAMSAQSILQYLNDSGEMDAYVDYAKGMNFEDIALYVGMNILLKNYVPSQIKNDPLALSAIEALGAQVTQKTLPGLPDSTFTSGANEDVRLRIAKARLEESLGLPPGSLKDYGWNNLLKNTGKRVMERELGLPALYLDEHDLEQMTALESVQAALEYAGRTDDSFNVINGTIEAIKNKDEKGLVMAGVQALALAFKVTPAQKAAMIEAAKKGVEPAVDSTSFPVTVLLSVNALSGLFSKDPAAQREAELELRATGLALLKESAGKAVPSIYSGLTKELLENIINRESFSVGDLLLRVGAARLAAETNLGPDKVEALLRNPRDAGNAQIIANQINEDLRLTGTSALVASDIQTMFKRGDTTVAKKIAAGEIDRAMKWNAGSALLVINHKKKFEDAMQESMANAIAEMLGLPATGYTLNGDTGRLFAASLIEQRLGLTKGTIVITKDTRPEDLLRTIGSQKSQELFGIDPFEAGKPFDKPSVIKKLSGWDLTLGLPDGTLRGYLSGDTKFNDFITAVRDSGFAPLTAAKIWDYYGLDERYRLSGEEVANMVTVLKDGDKAQLEARQAAINSVYRLLGRTVESKTGFNLDSFVTYITAKDKKAASSLLLDQGLSLFAQSIGINIPGITAEGLQQTAVQIKAIFNGDPALEKSRQELVALEAKTNRTNAEEVRLSTLRNLPGMTIYRYGFDQLTNFFLGATGIPIEYRSDAQAFLTGNFSGGLSSMSFVLWMKTINPYLPADSGLTYQNFRDTVVFDDTSRIDARADKIIAETEVKDADQQREEFRKQARRELMEEAKKNVEYRISDGFLRKADPTIPVGFTATIFSNDEKAKAALFERWAFNKLDALLLGADSSGYTAGTLETLYKGTYDQKKAVLVREIVRRTGISLGPISGDSMILFVDYLTTPKAERSNLLTDIKYGAMWSSVDSWLSDAAGLGDLPTGTARSFFLASQNDWDFNKEIKDANGNVTVASLNSLGESFILGKVSLWGDKMLHLPTGTVIRTYQAIQSVASASKALHAAKALGDATKIASSAKALSAAQASLTVLVITTALNACAACQQLFSTVDQAIAAPPGFTNAAVAGAIAMAFGLGPAGLYIAAAIYLFGVYKVEYLCPVPPKDPYAIGAYDQSYDQIDYGYPYDPKSGAPVKSAPAPGQNPFDWDDDVPFADGNNPQLWMGWARYFTGLLLDQSLSYGEAQDAAGQPRQIITFRQANVEFFADRATRAFGEIEVDNPKVGLGYTQTSTKTTDWVHVGFGGFF